jgi:methylenetetrahydrofolate reductase (NADPH)
MTTVVLDELNLTPETSGVPLDKPLPWRQSLGLGRRDESVRPIFWRNRNTSYVARTADWDEFPNGRWGDSRSPAFGELDAYGVGLKGTNEANIKLWGEPKTLRQVSSLFVRYLKGDLERLPWSEDKVTGETDDIRTRLIDLNSRGFLTINSQPAVNAAKSSDPKYGWGPKGGYVYQKAYLELFVFPSVFNKVMDRLAENPNLTYYAVTKDGRLLSNAPDEGPNAVTWGIFPNREIVQPTVVETVSFLAWKDEAFRLGHDWSRCYPADTPSRQLIETIMDECYLVNIVDNDFHESQEIFRIFDDLEVQAFDQKFEGVQKSATGQQNGTDVRKVTNGDTKADVVEKLIKHDQGKLPFRAALRPVNGN